MKRFFSLVSALLMAIVAFAQTPEEIVSRMEAEMEKNESRGIIMTMDVKVPVVGTVTTKTWTLGDKMRMEGGMAGVKVISWYDDKTCWMYNDKKNEVEITDIDGLPEESSDAEMFSGITDGYDVTLSKETDKAWYFDCKKSKSNKDKDAPKSMSLAISKKNYYPLSLSAKVSVMSITMRGISFGVTEKQVTFNPNDYPDATIVDKRK